MIRQNHRIFSILIVTVLMLACAAPSFVPAASTPNPVFDPNSINTVIVLTADAAATQTALMTPPTLTPTITLPPTNTLPPSETPTATFIFILPTSTVPSPTSTEVPTAEGGGTNNKFACRVESKSPSDNTTFAPGTDFSVSWRVTNTGSEKWDSASADYRYVSGDKIHQTAIYDLNKSVNVGKSTDLTVAMKAPGNAGSFSTTWNIFIGKTSFCKMKLTIIVK